MSGKTLSYVRRDLPAPAGAATRAAVQWMLAAYVLLILASLFLFHSHWVMVRGNEMASDRALFTAVNAATLTGFQQSVGSVQEFNATGGAGVAAVFSLMLAGMLFSTIAGGWAVVRIARLAYTDRQVVTAGLTAVALATFGGGACLANGGRGVGDAIFLAASAFGNSGLYIGHLVGPFSPATFLVLLPLALLGGLGLPVLMELFDLTFGRVTLSTHSRVVLRSTAIIYLGGLLVLFVLQLLASTGGTWRDAIGSSSVAAINSRTFGVPLTSAAALPAAAQWVLMLLMLIGGAPAGTAGGLKTTTGWHLVQGTLFALRGEKAGRPLGIALAWTGMYLVILFVGFLLLLNSVPEIPPDRLLFLAVSAVGNVGLSHDPVALTGPGLLILSALMLAGRVAPVAVLWWMASRAPETEVAIG